uniref:Uncharacterized protein n=2 Tax=Desulfobacterium TaxID=2295 RepID=E1YMD7_9BACT|nr:hypothetical protein N47_M25560 [uncultured Desulfobacterium sp.]
MKVSIRDDKDAKKSAAIDLRGVLEVEEYKMETSEISKTELKKIVKEAIISVLTERKDLLEDAVSEAILDMKLGLAIEEGDTGEYVSESEILSKLMD